MKLLTLNCHSWQEENQLEKIKYLAEVIKERDYDVISLQEVSQLIEEEVEFKNIKRDNFALLLIKELDKIGVDYYSFTWDYSHVGYDIYEEGLCILTKCNVIEGESFFISKGEDLNFWNTRKIVKLNVNYKNLPISIYSCHLGWWKDEEEPFKDQVDKLLDSINNDETSILMGDFNNSATIKGEGYDYLVEKGLYDTYPLAKVKDEGVTVKGKIAGWEKNSEDLRLDMIFSNKPLKVNYSKVIFNGRNKEVISDHFGVEVQLEL